MISFVQKIASRLNIVTPEYKPLVYTAIGATALATGAVNTSWESIRIIGLTVLTGAAYGIANDLIACRDCIEYFTVGHFYDGQSLKNRPIQSLNPNLNAVVWGMIATWHVCVIAGTFLSVIARLPLPGLRSKIQATQIAPYLIIGAIATIVLAHIDSRAMRKKMKDNPHEKYSDVPLHLQAGWEACNTRNSTGYDALVLGSIVLSVGILAIRIFKRGN